MLLLFSGSLANVRQIGIEFHWVPTFSKEFFTITQELYKLGFVTIMWDENRSASVTNKGSPLFEIVFRRSSLDPCKGYFNCDGFTHPATKEADRLCSRSV